MKIIEDIRIKYKNNFSAIKTIKKSFLNGISQI